MVADRSLGLEMGRREKAAHGLVVAAVAGAKEWLVLVADQMERSHIGCVEMDDEAECGLRAADTVAARIP